MLAGERTRHPAPRDPRAADRVIKIECEIDDMNPQLFGPLMDGLLAAGALDVFHTSVQMKKGRPGILRPAADDDRAGPATGPYRKVMQPGCFDDCW